MAELAAAFDDGLEDSLYFFRPLLFFAALHHKMNAVHFIFSLIAVAGAHAAVTSETKAMLIAYSGLHVLADVKISQISAREQIQDENGWLVMRIELTEKGWRAVLRDRFFNWWSYGSLAGEVWDQTYASLDPKDDNVSDELLPKSTAKGYRIHIFGGDTRRVYFMEPHGDGGRLYFFYLKW